MNARGAPVDADARIGVRIDAIRYAADGIRLIELRRPDGAPMPAFEPGAHVDVFLPDGLVRQYSLCGAPEALERHVIGVKRDAASRGGSAWLVERARVGDALEVGLPRNLFPLNEAAATSLFVAGGIGITPIACMVERLARLGRDWRLVYAVRRRADAAFVDAFARHGDRVRLHVDDEHGGAPLDVAALVAGAPADAQLYCCGPGPMLDAFEAATAARPRERVHVERFSSSTPASHEGGFTVELARSGRSLRVPLGSTIAEALLRAGVRVSVSCEQGICGTCETRVLAGIPDHRDSLLSDAERAANDVMMICCSGSKSDVLRLDL